MSLKATDYNWTIICFVLFEKPGVKNIVHFYQYKNRIFFKRRTHAKINVEEQQIKVIYNY